MFMYSCFEKHYIGCQLSTALSLRLPCLYISFYTGVTPNTLNPFWYPDIVHSSKSIWWHVSWDSPLCFSFQVSKGFWPQFCVWRTYDLEQPPWKSISTLIFHTFPTISCNVLQCLWLMDIEQCYFSVMRLESVFWQRLGAIKMLLELEFLSLSMMEIKCYKSPYYIRGEGWIRGLIHLNIQYQLT